MFRGLPVLQRRLDSIEGLLRSNLAPTPLVDEPSPKLDQHESSHSRALHIINDAGLTWWNACHDAWRNLNKLKKVEYNFPSLKN